MSNTYIDLGIETVACGSEVLQEFLQTHAEVIWVMQRRRGVTLDLRYYYFLREMITLALDFVRTMVDKETSTQQAQGTTYSNGTNTSDSVATSSRVRSSISTQASHSTQNSARSSVRSSSTSSALTSSQSSTRSGSGTDDSTQTQDLIRRNTGSNLTETTSSPLPSGTIDRGAVPVTEHQGNLSGFGNVGMAAYTKQNSRVYSESKSQADEGTIRWNIMIPFLGQLNGQNGTLSSVSEPDPNNDEPVYTARLAPSDSNYSFTTLSDHRAGESDVTHRNKVSGTGDIDSDMTTWGEGERANTIHRAMSGSMTGSSTQSATSAMTSLSHDEAHSVSDSSAHSAGTGLGLSQSYSIAQHNAGGASSLVGSGTSSNTYFSQIFESLQTLWKDTVQVIEQLEQRVLMPTRVVISRLAVRTPQSALAQRGASGIAFLTSNPFGTPFDRTIR